VTCPLAASALPIAIRSEPVDPARVFVRIPGHRLSFLDLGTIGTLTHRAVLGGMTLKVTIALDSGVTLDCEPRAISPARDLRALLGMP
jgi:hypothetical protein